MAPGVDVIFGFQKSKSQKIGCYDNRRRDLLANNHPATTPSTAPCMSPYPSGICTCHCAEVAVVPTTQLMHAPQLFAVLSL
jgi:hypothetical protein